MTRPSHPRLLPLLSALPDASRYRSYADLSLHQREGEHYAVTVMQRLGANTAILAPHGGRIEDGTSEVARAIAADDHHLYLFEGIRFSHNYQTLHLTSHCFDEPRCLRLLDAVERVVVVHGCRGSTDHVYLGGRDAGMAQAVAAQLQLRGIEHSLDGHPYPGLRAANICNRGRSGAGLQLEMTPGLRRSARVADVVAAVRAVLVTSAVDHRQEGHA